MDFFKSKQTLHRYPTDFLIGDLLVKAGVISQSKLDEAIKLSGAKHLQLGQMLIMSGAINASQLQAAVDAQSLVRDRTIDLNEALKVLKQACKSGQSIADVISSGSTRAASGPTNKLGEVLLEAGLINSDQFSKAMQRSLATGLPLGRILVLNNTLADAILSMALDLQVRVRDDMLTREEALDALRSAAGIEGDEMPDPNRVAQAQAALKAPRKHGVRIGEMFVRAGLLTETDVMNALETGLATDQLIGQVLVGQGFITDQILEAALGLQKMVDGNHVDVDKAIDTLSKIQSQGITYDEAVESLHVEETTTTETISFDHMLVLARVMTENEIHEAVAHAMEDPKIVGQILLMTGHLDKSTVKAALRAHFLLQKGVISQDDAVVGLDYTMHSSNKLSFDGALQELGWDISTLPKDEVDPETRAMEEARKEFGVSSDDELTKFVDRAKHDSSSETGESEPVVAPEKAEEKEEFSHATADELQVISGTYQKVEGPAEVTAKAEEDSWDVPDDEVINKAEETEEAPKRSLSGLLSHEDLKPLDADEVITAQTKSESAPPKLGGKFANLLGGDEPPAKKSSAAAADKEKAEAEKVKAEKEVADKAASDRAAAEALAEEIRAAEKLASDKRAAEKAAADKAAEEKAAAEKAAAEKAAAEKLASEKAAEEKAAAEKLAAEKAAEEKAAAEKLAAEKAAEEKATAEKLAAEKAAAEKAAAEKTAAEKAAAEKSASSVPSPVSAPAAGGLKKVGAFQSLLSEEPAKKADSPASAPAAPVAASPAAPVAAPAPSPAATTGAPVAAPIAASAAPAAIPSGAATPATPNVAAALSALTRAHPPTSGAHPQQTIAPAAAAPPAVARPAAPAGAPASGATLAQPAARPGIPAPVAAPGVAKPPAPVSAPAAVRPPAQPAPGVATAPAAHAGGANGSGQPPAAPRVTPPNGASQTAAPAAAIAPSSAAATGQASALKSEDDVKGALSGAYARLAESYYDQGNYAEALGLYEKILAVREQELGESDPELISDLANVVRVLCVQNRFDSAESYVRRIIGILEMTQPDDVQKLADALNTLAQIYFQQDKFDQCLPVLDRSVKLKQQVLGEDHVDMADCYRDYSRLLRKLNRKEEAEQYYSKAKTVLGKAPKQAVV